MTMSGILVANEDEEEQLRQARQVTLAATPRSTIMEKEFGIVETIPQTVSGPRVFD
jgi:hypothetical protein